jgi:hypothetical protein
MNKVILILFFIFFSNGELNAQKPKKIFSYLQENNLNLALEEYDKFKFDKVYDADKKLLFEIADCIFQINKSYSKYNPIESIKHFNKIYFNGFITYAIEDKEAIIKFLSKYNLTLEDISSNIYTEIVNEAKKINTVEYYDKALEVCSEKYSFELTKLKEEAFYRQTINERTIGSYKTFILTYSNSKHVSEIQVLLERKVFDNAKISASVYDLNTFLVEYPTSNLKQEAIDFRDSIVLSNVPNNFDEMLTFTNNYPNSKLTLNIINKLPNILYKELIKSKYDFTKCFKFIKTYPLDNRIIQLDSIIFKKVSQIDSVSGYEKYINLFENGIFKNRAQKKIDEKTISYEKILKCYSLDTLNLFLNCENLLYHSKVFFIPSMFSFIYK